MKKIIISLLIFGSITAAQAQSLRVAVEGAYPPFSKTTPSGEVVGFDIDIAKALCNELRKKCVLVTQDWDGMIPGLMARKYDAIIASMSITEERKRRINFTNKYYSAPARFIINKNDNLSAANYSLKGKTVGVQRGTIMDKFVTDNFESFNILNVQRYNTQDEANLDLIAGRIDLGFMEVATAEEFINSNSGKNFSMIGPYYSDERWFGEGIGIGVRKNDDKLRADLNNAIQKIRDNGVYKKINDNYFTYDIYGNN